ncbi:unnamed protein product, partial [Rotaria magnacalcarata]
MEPFITNEEEQKKPDVSDINLDVRSYEYARKFDLESPSVVSHLPSREYRQVFGVSDDIIKTVDDMTDHVHETLSTEREQNQQPVTSDEIPSLLSESNENLASEDIQCTLLSTNAPVSESVKRITEALEALEFDLREQQDNIQLHESSFPDTHEHVVDEKNTVSSKLATALTDDIEQVLKNPPPVFSSKEDFSNEDLLPTKIKSENVDEIKSTVELYSQYSKLQDLIDSLEKPLDDLQSSSSSIVEHQSITTEIEEKADDDHHLEDRYDTFIDHIRKLEEATHKSLIHDTNQEVVLLPQ